MAKHCRISRLKHPILGWLVAGCAPFLGLPLVPQTGVAPLPTKVFELRLPSDSTGTGSLALRLSVPQDPAKFRYGSQGAPVVVLVPGGFEPGDLSFAPAISDQGFASITFLFPGGRQGSVASDGVYDDRGDLCQRALRDVLRFATGQLKDSQGRSIEQVAGGPIRTDVAGMIGLSNGGSIAVTTLARYGEQIPPLAFLVGWESPTSDQVLSIDIGAKEYDSDPSRDGDGDGLPQNDGQNPAYRAYGFPNLDIDLSQLKLDLNYTYTTRGVTFTGLFYLDLNGNGRFDASIPGMLQTDANRNGRMDEDEDYPFPGLIKKQGGSPARTYLSVPVAEEAARRYPHWPSHYMGLEETRSHWSIRNACTLFSHALLKQPKLAGMTVFSAQDHVQVAWDHPHIHHWADAFAASGNWYRLNPDAAYVAAVSGQAHPLCADNDANIPVSPAQMRGLAQPVGAVTNIQVQAAAVAEMADRSHYGVWTNNLDQVITSSLPPSTGATHSFTFAFNCHDWVNPDQSAATLHKAMDILEKYGLKGEFYLTAPLVENYQAKQPDLIQRLKQSKHAIAYHTRAPHPVCFTPTQSQLKVDSLGDYENYRLDLTTGQLDKSAPGGYRYVASVFGQRPSAVGLNATSPELQAEYAATLAARGARMGVFDHWTQGGTGFEQLLQPSAGLYPRPVDYFLARTDQLGHPSGDRGNFWWNRVAEGLFSAEDLAQRVQEDFLDIPPKAGQRHFGLVVIHENDFYSEGCPWSPIYFQSADGGPLQPPYDLTRTGHWVHPRPPEKQARIWEALEAIAAKVSKAKQVEVLTSSEIALLGDKQFSPSNFPEKSRQWLKNGNLEGSSPEAYTWRLGRLEGDSGSPGSSFSIGAKGAYQGQKGLWIDAGDNGNITLDVRVDLDKGRDFSFGAWVQGSGRGSLSLALIPVNWVGDQLRPVSPAPNASLPLKASSDWQASLTRVDIKENMDFALLRIMVRGGGQWKLDDFTVESLEHVPVAFPEAPKSKVLVAFPIHIEDVVEARSDTPYYRAKTQLLKDLAELFKKHGALINLQPELDWILGASRLEPHLIPTLHSEYGMEFSVHTHGPKGRQDPEAVLAYIRERKNAMESAGAGPVTDLNGNFDQPDWRIFSAIGIQSQTAFKNAQTQRGYAGHYFHPWRPSPGNPYGDESSWALDNPSNPVVYLPGSCQQVTKFRDYLIQNVLPGLSYALSNAQEGLTTTWYFIGHVDAFKSKNGMDLAAYMVSEEYQEDLKAYDRLLGEIFGPLVERGFLQWSTPSRMREVWDKNGCK